MILYSYSYIYNYNKIKIMMKMMIVIAKIKNYNDCNPRTLGVMNGPSKFYCIYARNARK